MYLLQQSSKICIHTNKHNLGLDTRKAVFRVSDQVMFKQACSATHATETIEI